MGTETVLWQEKNVCVNIDVAYVNIGVDMKFEKGFNWGYRDTFAALLMTHYIMTHHITVFIIFSARQKWIRYDY